MHSLLQIHCRLKFFRLHFGLLCPHWFFTTTLAAPLASSRVDPGQPFFCTNHLKHLLANAWASCFTEGAKQLWLAPHCPLSTTEILYSGIDAEDYTPSTSSSTLVCCCGWWSLQLIDILIFAPFCRRPLFCSKWFFLIQAWWENTGH